LFLDAIFKVTDLIVLFSDGSVHVRELSDLRASTLQLVFQAIGGSRDIFERQCRSRGVVTGGPRCRLGSDSSRRLNTGADAGEDERELGKGV
jgi:hypothetical protein